MNTKEGEKKYNNKNKSVIKHQLTGISLLLIIIMIHHQAKGKGAPRTNVLYLHGCIRLSSKFPHPFIPSFMSHIRNYYYYNKIIAWLLYTHCRHVITVIRIYTWNIVLVCSTKRYHCTAMRLFVLVEIYYLRRTYIYEN